MERSTKSRNLSNYEVLSKYYDDLLIGDDDFSDWLKYIEDEKFGSVLELASGSGKLAGILKNKGYNVVASDISIDMKNASSKNYDGEYLILNMIKYDLNRKFDLIICICDSINYLDIDELDSFMECAYNHLNDKGRLIFDMHSTKRIDEFLEEYIEEGIVLDTPYQWSILSDKYDHSIGQHFVFYTNDSILQEYHYQFVYDIDLIKDKMNKYFKTEIISDFIKDEKVLVVGRK